MEDLENLNAVEILRVVLDRVSNIQNEVNTLRKRMDALYANEGPIQELHNKIDDLYYDLKSVPNEERMENFRVWFSSVNSACTDLEKRLNTVEANVEILAKSELKRLSKNNE